VNRFWAILVLACWIPVSFAAPAVSASDKDAFRRQYIDTGRPGAAIAFLLAEYREHHHYPQVAEFARLLLRSGALSVRERAETLQLLAVSERRLGNFGRERRAWMQFYNLTFSSDALLRVIQIYHQAGAFSQALDIANRVRLEALSVAGKTQWYRELGALYLDAGQLNNSLFVRHWLVQRQSTPRDWRDYSQTLLALGRLEEADQAIDRALKADPDDQGSLLQKARIAAAGGSLLRAWRILDKAGMPLPDEIRIAALQADALKGGLDDDYQLKRSIDSLLQQDSPEEPLNRHLVDLARLSLQSKLKHREKKLKIGFSNRVCHDDDGCTGLAGLASRYAAPEQAQLYARYQQNRRVAWQAALDAGHLANSIRTDSDTLRASLGLQITPVDASHLTIAIARQWGLGDNAQNNTRLSVADTFTRGGVPVPRPTEDRSWPYVHLRGEAAKLFEQGEDDFLYLEGRYGRTIQLNDKAVLSPFLFADERRHRARAKPDTQQLETGVGVMLSLDQFTDPYLGPRGQTELSFKAGRDLYVKEGDEAFRTQMGLTFEYQ